VRRQRRRFGFFRIVRLQSQSGVALRLPPHSKQQPAAGPHQLNRQAKPDIKGCIQWMKEKLKLAAKQTPKNYQG
jgi:hypothetical protein